MIFSKIVFSF